MLLLWQATVCFSKTREPESRSYFLPEQVSFGHCPTFQVDIINHSLKGTVILVAAFKLFSGLNTLCKLHFIDWYLTQQGSAERSVCFHSFHIRWPYSLPKQQVCPLLLDLKTITKASYGCHLKIILSLTYSSIDSLFIEILEILVYAPEHKITTSS